jgi:hypothetical protein
MLKTITFHGGLLLRLAARRYKTIDPLSMAARIRGFAQPSEVQEPIELLRAGIVFHARGLINTKAIQHNLDWIWPYWIERQFNPRDQSFHTAGLFLFPHQPHSPELDCRRPAGPAIVSDCRPARPCHPAP